MRVLGVHTDIDSSACLLEDGRITYALQEERFTGVKEQTGFPRQAIRRILDLAGIDVSEIDEIAVATKYHAVSQETGGRMQGKSVQQSLKDVFPVFFGIYEDRVPVIKARHPELFRVFDRRRNVRRLAAMRRHLGYEGPIVLVEHHTAHAASGYYSSPWRDEPLLVMSNDASGDGLSATISIGENGVLRRISQTVHTSSLGYLYTGVTGHLGFKRHSQEWKTMGLAPYAARQYQQKAYDVLSRYIGLSANGLEFQRKVPEPLHHIHPRLRRELWMHRWDGIAAAVQRLTEELMTAWTRAAIRKTGLHAITAGGGLYNNVKANKLIREMPEVSKLFVMPSPGDVTTSIGAAQWVYAQRRIESGQEVDIEPLGALYLGDNFTDADVERWLSPPGVDVTRSRDTSADLADLILKGEIVARVSGRMEFGARALMNRSLLCDANDLRNIRKLNMTIKSRDMWMPFAPSIKEDRALDYLLCPTSADYMVMAFDSTPAAQKDILAGLHQADFTCRPQLLRREWNQDAYHILEIYERETGRGGMVNTSANIHGEPIVHGAKEAISMFTRSGLKHMAIGNYLLSKP